MPIWYEVEHSKTGIYNFMECNWHFHDFEIERISYLPDENSVELFLKYDELKGSVILRFINVYSMNVMFKVEYGSLDNIMGSVLLLTQNGQFLWIDNDSWGDKSKHHIEELKKESSWVQAENIIWAVTDEYGNPTEMPANKIDQVWQIYGKIEHHHFDLKPYNGNNQE
ncbi:MAG: hypothetical protein IJZ93_04070 [Clostridia bacterium]|nr:hypothetical protein [Clostridia bacterium]